MEVDQASGGFLQQSLLSPPPSSVASTSTNGLLPHPRGHPLKPGGPKESALIRYVDQSILHIQRRFAKREVTDVDSVEANRPDVSKDLKEERVEGYKSFGDAAKDLNSLIDVVWISGTRKILYLCFFFSRLLTSPLSVHTDSLPSAGRTPCQRVPRRVATITESCISTFDEVGSCICFVAARP